MLGWKFFHRRFSPIGLYPVVDKRLAKLFMAERFGTLYSIGFGGVWEGDLPNRNGGGDADRGFIAKKKHAKGLE